MTDAVRYLETCILTRPKLAVVLGSGLGAFADELTDRIEIPYSGIPGWPHSTAVGHAGKLIFGKLVLVPSWGGPPGPRGSPRTRSASAMLTVARPTMASAADQGVCPTNESDHSVALDLAVLSGRAHLYEGHSLAAATMGVRVLGKLGVRGFVFTNAAGGINLSYSRGALVLISDHINLQGSNPLAGPNDDALGPRFPDMSDAYSKTWRETARKVAAGLGIPLPEGVYAAMLGPSYETPAEIRFLRTIGADLVGMSTVPEVIAANHMGLKALAISCVTNMAAGILPQKICHEEVLETGRQVRDTLVTLLKALLPELEA